MPMPRWFIGTATPVAESNSTRSGTAMRPASGRSRPATQRSMVVFPQPLGPSRVKNVPVGNSNETSRTPPACASNRLA